MKNNKLNLVIIFIIVLIGFFVFSKNIYSPLSDIGRELYIPQQISKGVVLYKDILIEFAPLGYLLNGLIIKLFGSSINTFLIIGFSLSLICLYACYYITELYTDKTVSLSVAVTLIPVCVFSPYISNWITPYSYPFLYALTAFLWSLYFLLKSFKFENKNFFILSCILFGFSIICKYEFIFFLLILVFAAIYKKYKLKYLLLILLFPLIAVIILLVQGCKINDFYNTFIYFLNFTKSPSLNYFYTYSGIFFNISNLKKIIISLFKYDFLTFFRPIYLIILVIFISGIKHIQKNPLLLLLFLSALFSSIKTIGGISLEIYGTFFLPLLFICLISFIYKYINKLFIIIFCIVIFISYSLFNVRVNESFEYKVNTNLTINLREIFYKPTSETIEYINENTNVNDTVLVIPESTIINYFTNRKSHNFLYTLVPPNYETITEPKIIGLLKSNPPDYIIISNICYPWYQEGSFIRTWGKNIYEYIQQEYTIDKSIGDEVIMDVYKKN
ncbi:glycosyltransferase family 39 protein [bacterium]|nr:glycosyltransferase family 39 protein [bacterium]